MGHPECFPAVDAVPPRDVEEEEEEKRVVVETTNEEEDIDPMDEMEPVVVTKSEDIDGNEAAEPTQNEDTEESDELVREPTDYSPQKTQSQSAEMDSDEVSLPSGMDDDGDVLNGDDNDDLNDDEFDLEDLDVDL